ncbi:CoA-binding protein [Roseiconus lacunae]|uniref:CoA-binding protein n=1 Tax=Roseiconus lacunae TaxID=2605694 RepID=UPI0011F177C6|nr:CoA-binding protein [Roseiconus lacunae]WRQ50692.1 CoA-binding protein [Stieleria sp. HD01]
MQQQIANFLSEATYAVAGASTRQHKYGNKVFRALVESGRTTYPLNPISESVEGHRAFPTLGDLPEVPASLSIVTPPQVTRTIIAEAIKLGVKHVWMQPGAEDADASQLARDAGLTVIDDGSCLLVLLARS